MDAYLTPPKYLTHPWALHSKALVLHTAFVACVVVGHFVSVACPVLSRASYRSLVHIHYVGFKGYLNGLLEPTMVHHCHLIRPPLFEHTQRYGRV